MPGQDENSVFKASVPFRTIAHLFDADDPSPEEHRELSDRAEVQIFRAVLDVPKGYRKLSYPLEITLPAADLTPVRSDAITSAIRSHFLHRSGEMLRDARLTQRIGLREFQLTLAVCIPSFIGIAICSQFKGGNPLAEVIENVLVIFCWVTIWQPFQLLVFDRWTQSETAKVYRKIADMEIHVLPA